MHHYVGKNLVTTLSSFAALSVFALKVHQDRAANANAALQGVGGNPIALVSEHYQNRR
jgi:hypothetical protein